MYLAIMLIGGILGGLIAHHKGRNVLLWTLLCGMPLMLLILLALPRIPRQGLLRPCPFCLRIVPWQAKVCAYCRRDLPPPRSAECKYCNATVWAGQERCPRCGNPSPWSESSEKESPKGSPKDSPNPAEKTPPQDKDKDRP